MGMSLTRTVSDTGPPSVWHESAYTVSPVMGLDVCVPDNPLHASVKSGLSSDTSQLLVAVVVHSMTDVSPIRKSDGVAVMVSSGYRTVTVTVPCPPFEHRSVYKVVVVGVTSAEPDTAPPVEKFDPELEDESAHDQVRVAGFPLMIEILFPEPPAPLPLKVGGVGGGGGGAG